MSNEVYKGIHGVDTSTAMFIHDPILAFEATDRINRVRPRKEWMGIEMYPIRGGGIHEVRNLIGNLTRENATFPPIPSGISAESIRKWQREFPNTYVARIHLPFAYNTADLWARAIGDLKQPRHFLWMEAMGAACNGLGIKLAQDLQVIQDREVGITAHANVIEGLARDGRLEEIKNKVSYILVESAGRNKTTVKMEEGALYDPTAVATIAKKYDLAGIVFGVDHALEEGIDIHGKIQEQPVREETRDMHIAGRHHDVIVVGDIELTRFLQLVAQTEFNHQVRATLDYDPRKVKRLSPKEQLRLLADTGKWIMQTQSR